MVWHTRSLLTTVSHPENILPDSVSGFRLRQSEHSFRDRMHFKENAQTNRTTALCTSFLIKETGVDVWQFDSQSLNQLSIWFRLHHGQQIGHIVDRSEVVSGRAVCWFAVDVGDVELDLIEETYVYVFTNHCFVLFAHSYERLVRQSTYSATGAFLGWRTT